MPVARLRPDLLAGALANPDDPRADADLLARFLAHADEAAFAALVTRHTPLVRAACRGWLRSSADIDDAAQATFLVLVRRAADVRNPAALPVWLYRVAGNVSRRLKKQLARAAPLPPDLPAPAPDPADDRAEAVAQEVARLPEKYRLPVQACYAAGLTAAEAAERLGCSRNTVLTRLARGRELLARRLAARGVSAAVLAGAAGGRAVSAAWAWETARAAVAVLAGETPAKFVAGRTILLTDGVVRTMMWKHLKAALAAAVLATGVLGFALGQWAAADPTGGARKPLFGSTTAVKEPPVREAPPKDAPPAADRPTPLAGAAVPRVDPDRPAAPAGRRREAVIRIPAGTFVKDVDVAPYGRGRITWTFEDDRVLGLIEVSVMGVELELATEAEFAMSSTGTIYGIVTAMRVNHVRLPDGEGFAELKPYLGLWPLIEPMLNEVMTDLPFSYQFRLSGNRLTILNYRILLAGPNPLGKAGAFVAGDAGFIVGGFQAIGTAIEGTYTAADAREPDAPPAARRPAPIRGSSNFGAPGFKRLFQNGGGGGTSYTVGPVPLPPPPYADGPAPLPPPLNGDGPAPVKAYPVPASGKPAPFPPAPPGPSIPRAD